MMSWEEAKKYVDELMESDEGFKRRVERLKQDHDVAVMIGNLGLSPSFYTKYHNAVEKIREF